MKWWPSKKERFENQPEISPAELSTMERLLSRDCSHDEFILLFVKLMQEAMPEARLEMVGEEVVRVVAPNGKEATIYLTNAWIKLLAKS